MEISRKINKYNKKLARTNNPAKIAIYKQKLKYYRKKNQHGGNGNDVYEGEKNDKGEPHGLGIMKYTDGYKYEGMWKDGKFYGQGVLTGPKPNDYKYEGMWKDGKEHGEGTATYSNRDKYVGNWEDGKYSGEGVYTEYGHWIDRIKNKYDGMWKDGKKHGHGVLTEERIVGDYIYDGDWKDGEKYGKGVETSRREKYVGEFKYGGRHGKGTETIYRYGNIIKYEGMWKYGKKHGKGVETEDTHGTTTEPDKSHLKYDGMWKYGKKHGKGVETHMIEKDIDYKYDGDFFNGGYDGYGVLETRYSKYKGKWNIGIKSGEGIIIYKNGDKYEGEWIYDNKKHSKGILIYNNGKGIITYANGDEHEGEWVKDKIFGEVILTTNDGEIYDEVWVGGNLKYSKLRPPITSLLREEEAEERMELMREKLGMIF